MINNVETLVTGSGITWFVDEGMRVCCHCSYTLGEHTEGVGRIGCMMQAAKSKPDLK